jgi:hypothetical protein
MAVAVIGGLIFSTVLSLVFVPAMFILMDDVTQFFWSLGKRLITTNATDDVKPAEPHDGAAAHGPAE